MLLLVGAVGEGEGEGDNEQSEVDDLGRTDSEIGSVEVTQLSYEQVVAMLVDC
jgi:hypothetical protein